MMPALVAALLAAQPLPMTPPPDDHVMELNATGDVDVPASEAKVSSRLEIIGREPAKVLEACEAEVHELNQALAALGVDPKDVQVLEGGSGPAYDEDGKASRTAARRQINVTVRELKKTPQVLALLSRPKLLTPVSVTYGSERSDDAQLKALESAAQRARRKADLLAAQLGFKVSRVYRLVESSGSPPAPLAYNGPSITLPVAPPLLKASVRVDVIFELEGGATAPAVKPTPAG